MKTAKTILFAGLVTLFLASAYGSPKTKKSEQADFLYQSTENSFRMGYENLVISKNAGSMKFDHITEFLKKKGGEPDVMIWFKNHESGNFCSLTLYKAPKGTFAPKPILDARGKPKEAMQSDNPYTVLDMLPPSQSYWEEFEMRIRMVEEDMQMKCVNKDKHPIGMRAVPSDMKNSPVAYVACFEGTGGFRHPSYKTTPWTWVFWLFVVGDHYVKIHVEGPTVSEPVFAGMEVINAIGWTFNSKPISKPQVTK